MHLQTLAKTAGITTAKAERFLLELANLRPSKEAHERILKRFPEFFPEFIHDPKTAERLRDWILSVYFHGATDFLLKEHVEVLDGHVVIFGRKTLNETWEVSKSEFLIFLSAAFLPDIWASTDLRAVQWKIFGTRLFFRGPTDSNTFLQALIDPPPANPFEVAMLYLWENFHRTKRCKNPSCKVTPYFFAKKKGQEYCSDLCATEAQREYKRKWWAERGSQWRRERNK